jgi:tyrosinase
MFSDSYTKEVIEETNALNNYPDFRYKLEGTPHGAIHSAVGGDMSPATSPNGKCLSVARFACKNIYKHGLPETDELVDPIFFLHHTQIDRLWTLWQQEKPDARIMDFGGRKTQAGDFPEATLQDVMPYLGLTPDVKVEEVMATQTSRFCYRY